jgi:hypothetical protein
MDLLRMTPIQFDVWVEERVSRILAKQPDEDSIIDVKRAWKDAEKAGRQLAGHANAARGTAIVWLIGLQGSEGLVGATTHEVSNWYAQVRSQMDGGITPRLVLNRNVPYEDKTIVALLFETTEWPYVVKVGGDHLGGGDKITFETPWRQANSVRSASRSEPLKMLAPLQNIPRFTPVSGYANVQLFSNAGQQPEIRWYIRLLLYCEFSPGGIATVPYYRCTASIQVTGRMEPVDCTDIQLSLGGHNAIGLPAIESLTIHHTTHDLTIQGPGMVYFIAWATSPGREPADLQHVLDITIHLAVVGSDQPALVRVSLDPESTRNANYIAHWKVRGETIND